MLLFFFKQKTAYEMRISDWSSDVCSSDLLAFLPEARLILRHAEQARRAAQLSRLTGTVSVGLAPTTVSVLALPFMRAMRERYPDVRLHMVESLSGHLADMLDRRQLDLAILFHIASGARWNTLPLLWEELFRIKSTQAAQHPPPT